MERLTEVEAEVVSNWMADNHEVQSDLPLRPVRASVIRCLVLGLPVQFPDSDSPTVCTVGVRGVRFWRLHVIGPLQLGHAHGPGNSTLPALILTDCTFHGSVELAHSNFRLLGFSKSRLSNLEAERALVVSHIFLDSIRASDDTDLSETCHINLLAAEIGGVLVLNDAVLQGNQTLEGNYDLSANLSFVKASGIQAQNIRCQGQLNLYRAKIVEDIFLRGASLDGQGGDAFSGDGLHVGGAICFSSQTPLQCTNVTGSIALRRGVVGALELDGVSLSGDLLLQGTHALSITGDPVVDLAGSRTKQTAESLVFRCTGDLWLNDVTVDQHMSFDRAICTILHLRSAIISGEVQLLGTTLTGSGETALDAQKLHVGGTLIIGDSHSGDVQRFKANATLDFLGANIGGEFNLSAMLSPTAGTPAIFAYGLTVGGSSVFGRTKIAQESDMDVYLGPILMSGAKIARQFFISGVKVYSSGTPGGPCTAAAVMLDSVRIGEEFFVSGSFLTRKEDSSPGPGTIYSEFHGAFSFCRLEVGRSMCVDTVRIFSEEEFGFGSGSLDVPSLFIKQSEMSIHVGQLTAVDVAISWSDIAWLSIFESNILNLKVDNCVLHKWVSFFDHTQPRASFWIINCEIDDGLLELGSLTGKEARLENITFKNPLRATPDLLCVAGFPGLTLANLRLKSYLLLKGLAVIYDPPHSSAENLMLVTLNQCSLENLIDDGGKGWGEGIELRLNAFTVNRRPERSAAETMAWFRRQFPGNKVTQERFTASVYDDYSKLLRTEGYEREAKDLTKEKLRLRNRLRPWYSRILWTVFADRIYGFGLSPLRAVAIFIVCWLAGIAGTFVADHGWQRFHVAPVLFLHTEIVNTTASALRDGANVETGIPRASATDVLVGDIPCGAHIQPAWYALTTFVPTLDLGQSSTCEITYKAPLWRGLRAMYTLLGWIVTPLTLLAIPGFLRAKAQDS